MSFFDDATYDGYNLDVMFSAPSRPDHPAALAAEAANAMTDAVQYLDTPSTSPSSTISSPHADSQASNPSTTPNPSPSPTPHPHITAQKATNATIANRLCAIQPAIYLLNTMAYIDISNLPSVADRRYTQFIMTALPNTTIDSTWRKHTSSIHLTTPLAGEGRVSFPGVSNSIMPAILANPAATKSVQAARHAAKEQEYYSDIFAATSFLDEWARDWPNKMAAKARKLRVCVSEEEVRIFATVPSIAVGQKVAGAFEKVDATAAAKFDAESARRAEWHKYYQKEEEDEERKLFEGMSGMSGMFAGEMEKKGQNVVGKRVREEDDEEEIGSYLTKEQWRKRVRLGRPKKGGAKA